MAHDDLVTKDHYSGLVASMDDPEAQLATAVRLGERRGEIVPTVFSSRTAGCARIHGAQMGQYSCNVFHAPERHCKK